MTIIFATLISLALIAAYVWGYRAGVAYCVKQVKSLEEAHRELVKK